MYTDLDKAKIIESAQRASKASGISAIKMVEILSLNSETVENGDHIEQILERIENGEAVHIDSNNNQFTYYDRWAMDGLEYTITHFPSGDFIVDETLPLDPSDFA